jgi:hypothetical protein
MEDLCFGDARKIASALSSDYNNEDTVNEARAKSAWNALLAYVNKVYGNAEYEPVEQGLRDLLGDLQHLCVTFDLSFEELLSRATKTFKEEQLSPLG